MRRALAILLSLSLGGCQNVMKAQMRMVSDLKVKDAVADYETARSGAALDRCVKAKLVAIAYEDAKDPTNAAAWRAREREDCAAAIAAAGVDVTAARPGT